MAERQTIDARGAFCPGPLMELIAALKLAAVGEEVEIWSSDKGSVSDIPAWVAKVGHVHMGTVEFDGYWSVVVKRAK